MRKKIARRRLERFAWKKAKLQADRKLKATRGLGRKWKLWTKVALEGGE